MTVADLPQLEYGALNTVVALDPIHHPIVDLMRQE